MSGFVVQGHIIKISMLLLSIQWKWMMTLEIYIFLILGCARLREDSRPRSHRQRHSDKATSSHHLSHTLTVRVVIYDAEGSSALVNDLMHWALL